MVRADKRKQHRRTRKAMRVRNRVRSGVGHPRLSVFRSLTHIYVQVIDDRTGSTLAAASSNDKDLRESAAGSKKADAAARVGVAIAARAKEKGVTRVVFDRGRYRYHGRVKALADAARESGLQF